MHTVRVFLDTCQVFVVQTRKTVWVATGEFMGRPLLVKGTSEASALRKWEELANHRLRTS